MKFLCSFFKGGGEGAVLPLDDQDVTISSRFKTAEFTGNAGAAVLEDVLGGRVIRVLELFEVIEAVGMGKGVGVVMKLMEGRG